MSDPGSRSALVGTRVRRASHRSSRVTEFRMRASKRGRSHFRSVTRKEHEQAVTGPSGSEPREVVVHGSANGFAQEIAVGRHRLVADEPAAVGGTDAGAGPYDLLLAALGSCTSMTVALYARRKQWPLESVQVRLRHAKVHATDCEDCETKVAMLDRIECDIELVGPLDDEQRARLLDIANKCPVHRTLVSEIVIATRLLPRH